MTQDYYNKHAKDFIENTLDIDMDEQYELFEKYLSKDGKILDIGFGSGRDSFYFSSKYDVMSIDNCEAFVEEGKKKLNNQVILMNVLDIDFTNEFDGIWACASLLHIPFKDLPKVLNKCYKALKNNSVIYMSFKYGDFEGIRNGRYFTFLNEKRLKDILDKTSFELLETMISLDVRPDREEKWLNVVISK